MAQRGAFSEIWAKSPARGGDQRAETLTVHTSSVLARLAAWRSRYPALPNHTSRSDLWDLAAWACALHDAGKVAAGFQSMLRGGTPFVHRHEALSLVAVGWLSVDDHTCGLVAAGVCTHHRDLLDIGRAYSPPAEVADLLEELGADGESEMLDWVERIARNIPVRHGFAHLPSLTRIDTLASWKRSFGATRAISNLLEDQDATTPFALTARFMRGLIVLADHAASAHEGLPSVPQLDDPENFSAVLLRKHITPYDHQKLAAETTGHALLIAPTGSGKTEAAILWASQQRAAQASPRTIFYILPHRASLNAMHSRMIERYELTGDTVVLQHASTTATLYARALEKGYTPDKAVRDARHGQALGRLMTAPVRVLTPYQLLRALFGLKGHEAMLTDAAGGIFILDELHAYDIQRLSLILAGVQHLVKDLGARVLAMSATFPQVLQEVLNRTLGNHVTRIQALAETYRDFRRHVLRLHKGDLLEKAASDLIIARCRRGEAVLAVCTTVARAQSLYDLLLTQLEPAALSLYTAVIQLAIERRRSDCLLIE